MVAGSQAQVVRAYATSHLGRSIIRRELIEGAVEQKPDQWQGHFNLACFEMLYGDKEAGISHLQRAHELEPKLVAEATAKDSDFDAVRDDPRVVAIAGAA